MLNLLARGYFTFDEEYNNNPPTGPKMIPTAKKSGRTVLGVRMGAYASRRCWRKAVLGGLRDFGFFSFLLSLVSLTSSWLLFLPQAILETRR